ncbi:hypothetical protein AB0J20_29675 [Micromonospora costi]|uniref:hypothetical protein n=1 Tax=Micromonospora costi TaxID=1530042 RepID=UPI0034092F8B
MKDVADDSDEEVRIAKTVTLRQLLARALRKQGFGEICKEEPGKSSRWADVASQNLLLSVLLGLLLFASFRFGWHLWLTASIIFGSLLLLVFAVMAGGCTNMLGYLAYVIAWLALGVYLLGNRDYDSLLLTHVLPFFLVIGGRWAARAVRFTTHIPFFIPITLLLILTPLISEDPWRVASASGWRIGVLAAVALTPLCVYLLIRLARLDVATTLFSVVETLNARDMPIEKLWKGVDKFRNKPSESIDSEASIAQLGAIFQADKEVTTNRLAVAVVAIEKRFRRLVTLRVVSVIVGVWIAVTGLIYLLALIIMPSSLAADWSRSSVNLVDAQLFGWDVTIPAGPYLHVALLLGTVASVGFAGFVLTEEKYFEEFTKGIIGKPAEQYLTLALPYLALADEDAGEGVKGKSQRTPVGG